MQYPKKTTKYQSDSATCSAFSLYATLRWKPVIGPGPLTQISYTAL